MTLRNKGFSKKMNIVLQLFVFDMHNCNDYDRARKHYRMQEYSMVFLRNLTDPHIKSIHVLCENQMTKDYFDSINNIDKSKVIFTIVGHQPTYKEIMEYVKGAFMENELICIMNGDIYFNSEKDHILIKKYLKPKQLFALTRHEQTDPKHTIHNLETCPFTTDNGGSADTFIFRTPIPESFDYNSLNHKQNMFSAENVFMNAWHKAGFEIFNPCDEIITMHLHKDRVHFQKYDYIGTEDQWYRNGKTHIPTE